jgi:putative RNA 2'-phosphotransferase
MKDRTRMSKLLAYVLRHSPGELGLELDPAGWTDAALLLARLRERRGVELSLPELESLVASDAKGRYSLRGGRIRANQGHSVEVDAVDPAPRKPPAVLYHGTTAERWAHICRSGGLSRMRRHHVHLSDRLETARQVAARHRLEQPLVLLVDAERMHAEGHVFLVSDNGVWLTGAVPRAYLQVLPPEAQGRGSAP